MRSKKPLPLKQLVNFLFDNIKHPDGRPYTSQEVAEQVRISHATINQLRTGRNKNPTLPTLQELCIFFNVPLGFFDCASYDECFAVIAQDRMDYSPNVVQIAFRAGELSPASQKDLLNIISWVEAAERERKAGRDVPDFPLEDKS